MKRRPVLIAKALVGVALGALVLGAPAVASASAQTQTVHFTFVDLGNALGQLKGGRLKALGVTSEKRSSVAPDIPAIAETLHGYELIAWFGLMAPAGTPKEIVAKLHDVAAKGVAKPEVKERFAGIGTDVALLNPEELAKFIQSEIAKWARLTQEAGIQPE